MFTGIIRHCGEVQHVRTESDGTYITVQSSLAADASEGDSIALNGVCVTVLTCTDTTITFRLMAQTIAITALGTLDPGMTVNLEQPVAAGERFDGHFVLGHVDDTATLIQIAENGNDKIYSLQPPNALMRYIVPKGSIALNGVSLTVVDVTSASFSVSLMPYTLTHTNLGTLQTGSLLNVEVDMIAKHVAKLVA